MQTHIPYGDTELLLRLAADADVELLCAPGGAQAASQAKAIEEAMAAPIGSPRLQELARGKQSAVIICSDHTRPVPSRLILPPMLAALRQASPNISITLLIATGCHRLTTKEELRAKFGDEIFNNEQIVVHDCDDEENLQDIGALPSGARLIVNKVALQADLLLAEGFIEPHFFAGFSGGRKSVLPGICARKAVLGNHCAQFISSKNAVSGVLEGNPIHNDMASAVRMAKLQYIVNVIIDEKKQVVQAFAGDAVLAHEAGCRALAARCAVTPTRLGDVVITSNGGAPLDQNVYQTVKGMSTAEAAAAKGAVIVLCAACKDGIGGKDFYAALKGCTSAEALLAQIETVPMDETLPDQWQVQILARILKKHRVIMVTDPSLETAVQEMKMEYAKDLAQAISMATKNKKQPKFTVIPDGVSLIVGRVED